jgi:hypothetical protein
MKSKVETNEDRYKKSKEIEKKKLERRNKLHKKGRRCRIKE